MSFAPKTESPTLSPSTPERRNTFQEAEAVPFGNGYFRVAPKWVSDRFNDHWSNGKTTGQSYCSVAGILCHGPINHIQGVYAGGKLVAWPDITRPDNPLDPNYWSVMIEFGGADADLGPTNRMRVYWGREDQPADSWLLSTSGQDHPPYLGQVLIVFERLHCGQIQANSQQRPALPNIELSVIRLPSPSMPSGLRLPATVGSDRWRGINLISGLWDILTHPRAGAGLTTSFLDEADWVAKAAALEDGTKPAAGLAGADAYVSPLLTGASETEKIVLDGLAYVDGWFHTVGGKIRVDWYPNDGNVPGSLPEISEHDMVEPPRVRTGSLAEAPSTIVVECLEGDTAPHDLVEASESVNVPFVRELTGEISVRKLQRPWFTSRGIAGVYASRAAAMATIPEMTGECRVRLDRAIRLDGTPLRVGDRFSFNYAPQSIVTTARITERLEDETTATLRWRRERGVSSQPYVPASDPRAVYTLPDPPTPGATDWTVAEAPPGLSEVPAVVALVRRPSDALSGVRVYLDEDNAWATGSTLLGVQNFAARVTLSGAIGSGDLTCTLTGTDPDVSPTLGSGVTTTEQTDDTLIMLMESEWISLGGVVSGGPGTYTVDIARGRLGSFAAAHADGEYGWVIRRDRVVVWLNAVFTQLVTRYFKVAYYHALADGPLSAAQSVVFSDRAPGAATSFAAVGLPGAIRLTWDNPDETDLLGVRIYESATTTQPADPSWFVAYPGNTFTRDDLAGGVQRYFWIVEVDQTYNTSTTVGPVDATTTSAAAGSDGVGAWTPLLAGTATTSGGSFYKKTGSAAWDASVYSQEGYYRGAAMGARCGALANVAFGLDASPAGSSSNTTIDYAFRLWDGGQIDIVENGTVVASAIGTQVANTTVFQVIYDNTAVRYYVDGVLKRTTTAAADQTLYLDSSLYTVNASAPVLTNVSFAAAGPVGSTGPATPVAQITFPGQAFTRANSGSSYSPASITLTSSLANGTASSWLWEYWNGSAWTTAPGTATASTYSVASGDFADARTYRVTINSGYSAAVTMIHVTGGADGAAGLHNAVVTLYRRAASSPALPTTSATYTFSTGVLTGHNNGWTQAIPAIDGNPLWATGATASSTSSTDTIASGEWATAVKILEDGADGSNGANGLNQASVFLFQRSASAPSVPASSLTYTFATGVLSGTLGAWTQTVPAGSNPLYVTTATAISSGATDTIASGEWATPQIHAQNGTNGTNGTNGADGAGYGGTSTTSLTFGTGSKTLTTQTGLAYTVGSVLRLIDATDASRYMEGDVTAHNSGTGLITFNSLIYSGTGTHNNWRLSIAGLMGFGPQYRGAYNSSTAYYLDSKIVDIVSHAGNFYRAVNPAKNGLTTWGTPGASSDWTAASSNISFGAARLFLIEDATILKTLVLGDGTTGAGIIRWNTATLFGTGTGLWMGYDGTVIKFRAGVPSGNKLEWDGTKAKVVGEFSAGTGDALLNATSSGTTFGNTSAYHVAATTTVSGRTVLDVKNGASTVGRFGAYDIGGGITTGQLDLSTTAGASMSLTPARLSFDGVYWEKSGSNMKSTATVEVGALKHTYLEVGLTTAVDVKDVNLRGYSGGTQNWRIDYTNGRYYVQGNAVLNTRYGSTPTDVATLVACLQHHGLCP